MIRKIYLAGGCFWGIDEYFSRVEGVVNTVSGYAQSKVENPSYDDVCTGSTCAAETVLVEYDTEKINLENIFKHFFGIINPVSLNRQGFDIGTQYRTGIYYNEMKDKETAENFIKNIQKNYLRPVAVEVKPLKNFYKAEEYHQDYLKKNPDGYCHIDLSKADEQI